MKSRKTNRAKRIDRSCKNNGSCTYCRGNRLHSSSKHLQDDPIEEAILRKDDKIAPPTERE